MKTITQAQIHRFMGRVAIYLEDGQTVYLDVKQAAEIAKQINACKRDIQKQPVFSESTFRTWYLK